MPPSRPEFRPDLEGIRGVAIILVVLFHVGASTFAGGFVGVDVFFVLSGFFITGLLVRESEETGSVNLSEFYAKRALRLLPMILTVLFTTLAVAMWQYAPIDRTSVAENARAVAMYSGNMAFANGAVDYFSSGENPLLHTWSLAVEQQFYFFWPLVFVFIGIVADRSAADTPSALRQSIRKPLLLAMAVLGLISFCASLLLTRSAQPWAFFSMPTRVWEFALGGMIALSLRNIEGAYATATSFTDSPANVHPLHRFGTLLQVAAFVAIAGAVFIYDSATPYPGFAALVPAAAAVLLILGGHGSRTGRVSRALGIPPLQWLGRMSYGWYLWHWPLVGLGGVLNPQIGVWGKLAWCVVALVLAWLTYTHVEQRARLGSLGAIPSQRLSLFACGATVVALIVAQAAVVMSRRAANTPEQKMFAAARGDRIDHGCWGTTVEQAKNPCEFGDRTSSTTVVLFGDSHAEHWFGALDRVGRERGWKIVLLVKGGCPVPEMPGLQHRKLKRYYFECTRFREAMMQRILALKPAVAVLSSFDHYLPTPNDDTRWKVTPEMWESGLRNTYSRLSAAGIPVVAVRGTPRTGFGVPSCLSRKTAELLFAQSCEYSLADGLIPRAVAAQNTASRGLNVRFVDMNDIVCNSTPCKTRTDDGAVIFTDDNHLTVAFSRSVANVFGNRIATAAGTLGRTLP